MSEYLMCARDYCAACHDVRGWLVSEKLDGWRCFSDGGSTRGLCAADVPWSTVTDRTAGASTGLWTRSGKVIHAPAWWLDELPAVFLDGELWTKRNDLDRLKSICKKKVPIDDEWGEVTFRVFDSVPVACMVHECEAEQFNVMSQTSIDNRHQWFGEAYEGRLAIVVHLEDDGMITSGDHQIVPKQNVARFIQAELDRVTALGGEGLIFRNPASPYTPGKSYNMLRLKKIRDMEGTVVGHTPGKGRGSITLDVRGNLMKLGGLPESCIGFHNGTRITFQYTEMSRHGIPQHARFLRRR